MDIRVRVAPSPTGTPHIGFYRTAVFNWLFARANNGKFILRIEDTDQQRLVANSQAEIIEGLKWLGLDLDEGPEKGGEYGPYVQSQRLDFYTKYSKQLLESGQAYKEDGAIKFRTKTDGITAWEDLVHGRIEFQNDTFGDFVIIKSDGFPTYHFAHVVDDHLMKISHVFRGDEWISSTPKHIQLFEALGWADQIPHYVHLPLILGPDKAKLSKRHGAESVMVYRDGGYLSEAMFNFLAVLGWSPKTEKEIFSRKELIKAFEIKGINPTMPIFNIDKLNWFNGQYIRNLTDNELTQKITDGGFVANNISSEQITKVIPLVKERMATLKDFAKFAKFFFEDFTPNILDLVGKNDKDLVKQILTDAQLEITKISDFTHTNLETAFRAYVEKTQQKPGIVFMILRVAITGSTTTPPLFETMEVLGKQTCADRIKLSLEKI